MFLLSTLNVTNRIIFGFGLEQFSWRLEEQHWPELSIWGHFQPRDYTSMGLSGANHLIVAIAAKWHVNGVHFMVMSCTSCATQETLHVGSTTIWVLEERKEKRID